MSNAKAYEHRSSGHMAMISNTDFLEKLPSPQSLSNEKRIYEETIITI